MNLKVFSSILAVLIIISVLLVYFSFTNKPQEAKVIKDVKDLSNSYYEIKQKDFINVLYVQSDTRFNGTSIYYFYIKNRNKFTAISNKCNESLDVRGLGTEEIKEDDFLAGVHAFPVYYSYEVEHFEQPQIIDYSNMFLSFGCFNTTSTKNNETNKDIVCFNQPSGIITKFDTKFNSNNVESMRFFNSTELNFSSSRNLLYASFKEENPEDIIKNSNPCNANFSSVIK